MAGQSGFQFETEHLIIVCCHAIYLGNGKLEGYPDENLDDGYPGWLIEKFQLSEVPTFIKHISRGIEVLRADSEGVLVFSGGPTKGRIGCVLSEGQSYVNYAVEHGLLDTTSDMAQRVYVDPSSYDSYQNLLHPILLYMYHHLRGEHPRHITIISHDFKRRRFLDLHAKAIRWPLDKITYIGINPPKNITPWNDLMDGEMKRGYLPWSRDLYGKGPLISEKRKERQLVQGITIPDLYTGIEWLGKSTELANMSNDFMNWDGGITGTELYKGRLPWDDLLKLKTAGRVHHAPVNLELT